MARHARVGPSGVDRALRCTNSVRLSDGVPPPPSSIHAATGTVAHAILNECLVDGLDVFEIDPAPRRQDGFEVELTTQLLTMVQGCLDWVRFNLNVDGLLLEHSVSYPFLKEILGEPVFGTLDVANVEPELVVVDAKFGHSPVPASAPQLMMYLLGLALEYNPTLDGDGVAGRTVVLQPKTEGGIADVAVVTWEDLREFRDWLADGYSRLAHREWNYSAGAWCRFCPALAGCRHVRGIAIDAALTRAVPTPELVVSGEFSRDALAEALNAIEILDAWKKAVVDVATLHMEYGGTIEGYALAPKRANRVWQQPDANVAEILTKAGIDPWGDPKLISPAEAERRLPKVKRDIVGTLAGKPEKAGWTLVKADDPKATAPDEAALFAAGHDSAVARGMITTNERIN